MPVPTTTNRAFLVPTRGSETGIWDVDVNGNWTTLDNMLGGTTSVALASSPVTLSSGQYQCGTIILTGTLTANCLVTFPAVSGWWTVFNNTTDATDTFVPILTCGAGQVVGIPHGRAVDIFTDGTNVRFRHLPPIGSYLDHAGTAVPAWVSACTVPPLLYCNGATFSASTYPRLNAILGGVTLPDFRGCLAGYLNDGTDRINVGRSGVDGNTRLSRGGGDASTLAQTSLPNVTLATVGTVNGSITPTQGGQSAVAPNAGTSPSFTGSGSGGPTVFSSGTFGTMGGTATVNLAGGTTTSLNGGVSQTSFTNMPPTTIGGIRMIWAA